MDIIKELTLTAVNAVMQQIVEQAISTFSNIVGGISSMAVNVLDMPIVNNSIMLAQGIALAILAPKVAFEVWYNYILRQNGDPDQNLSGVLIRAAQSVAIIASVPWIVKEVYQFGSSVAQEIAQLPGYESTHAMGGELEQFLRNIGEIHVVLGLLIIFGVAFTCIVFVQSFIRAAELAVIAVVGAFMSIGLTNNTALFGTWWRELVAVSLTQALQMFMLKFSFHTLQGLMFTREPIVNMVLFLACLYVTYKTPSIMRQYVHSTGFGRMIGGAAQQASSLVLMRKLMKG